MIHFKMCCYALCLSKFKLLKEALFTGCKICYFAFFDFLFIFFNETFVKSFMKIISF